MRSVKRIVTTTYYTHNYFPKEEQLTLRDIHNSDWKKYVEETVHSNNSTSGTAVVIYNDGETMALLTCAHVVLSPDSLVEHFYTEKQYKTPFIKSYAQKDRQHNLVLDGNSISSYSILATDSKADLALLKVQFENDEESSLNLVRAPEMELTLGRSQNLSWGDFVYLAGFPKGRKMVSRSLVSLPDPYIPDRFYLDASFNPGFSGGIVVGVRSDTTEMHWLGMANSAFAETEYYLTPRQENEGSYDPFLPYNESVYIKEKKRINYGVTNAISAKVIRGFLRANQTLMENNGIVVDDLLMAPEGDQFTNNRSKD